MSLRTVLRDDLRNTGRSAVVLAVVGVLAALVALVVYSVAEFHADAYRALFDVSFLLFLVFPLALAPLTYLAVAGDRQRGTIKYTLGLPNTRLRYLLGTALSRVLVAVGAVLVATLVALLLGVVLYDAPVEAWRFGVFAAVSGLFVASLTALFVALSALTASRSRAMFAVIGAYFVLGPFWFGFLPVVSLVTVLDFLTSTLGVALSESTREFIQFLSPTTAYLAGLEPVYDGVVGTGTYERIDRNYTGGSGLHTEPWFNYLTMAAWGLVGLAVAYVRFRRAELG